MPTRKSKVCALRALKLISALSMKEATTEKKIDVQGRYGRMRGEEEGWSREREAGTSVPANRTAGSM